MSHRKKKMLNRWKDYRRTEFEDPLNPNWVNKEKIFANSWEEENVPCHWLNHGHGILQNLFCKHVWPFCLTSNTATHIITRRERMIVATIIQWLGSNVGFCWLEQTPRKAEYELKRKPTQNPHSTSEFLETRKDKTFRLLNSDIGLPEKNIRRSGGNNIK